MIRMVRTISWGRLSLTIVALGALSLLTGCASCLDFKNTPDGTYPKLEVGDYKLHPVRKELHVRTEPLLPHGTGDMHGLSMRSAAWVIPPRIASSYEIEYAHYNPGPILVDLHDATGGFVKRVRLGFDPPQATKKKMIVEHALGIGLLAFFGPPQGSQEALVSQVCTPGRSGDRNTLTEKNLRPRAE
jgi:hypothetical protein